MPAMRKSFFQEPKVLLLTQIFSYTPFTAGNATGSFMTNPDGSLYIGDVWPGYTVFPDWLSGGAGQWWIDSFKAYYDNVHFDGIWIDMSEASSFCVGSCGSGYVYLLYASFAGDVA